MSSLTARAPVLVVHLPGPPVSPLLRPLIVLLGTYVALSALLRLLLWTQFGMGQVAAAELPAILALGAVNDLVESLYLFAPLALYLALAPPHWHRRRGGARLLFAAAALMLFGMLFLAAMEYFFFEEFDARFNLVAVDYLIYPTEVIGDIRAEYPVASLSLALAAAALLLLWGLRGRLLPAAQRESPWLPVRLSRLLLPYAALLAAAILWWPADRIERFHNGVANELSANGPAHFFAAFRTNHIDYHAFYRSGDPLRLRELLARDLLRGGGQFTNLAAGDLTRRFEARADGLGKLNVVLLSEESLGAEFVGAYGDRRGLTPEFDALARQGILFRQAYATGTRTVRGLEAFSASFPPIPSESIVKRPGNQDIATWGKVMARLGYHTSFLYGGYGAFDNMNAYFGGNGFALSDRSDILQPGFANVWGVSDDDLFRHAIGYFDARAREGRPFFSIVMSTSNHKPYTFPQGIEGIKPQGGGRSAGVRYADHALGAFFREARRHAWFEHTVFVIAADHGARVYGKADIPLYSYEIPVLILAPSKLAPREVDTRLSQIDIAPTVLGLLGLPYEAPFFGEDVLHWPQDQPRTLLMNHNHNVAALRGEQLCILGLHDAAHCERYRRLPGRPGPETTRLEAAPLDAELVDLATAYYQTAYDQFQGRRYR